MAKEKNKYTYFSKIYNFFTAKSEWIVVSAVRKCFGGEASPETLKRNMAKTRVDCCVLGPVGVWRQSLPKECTGVTVDRDTRPKGKACPKTPEDLP